MSVGAQVTRLIRRSMEGLGSAGVEPIPSRRRDPWNKGHRLPGRDPAGAAVTAGSSILQLIRDPNCRAQLMSLRLRMFERDRSPMPVEQKVSFENL